MIFVSKCITVHLRSNQPLMYSSLNIYLNTTKMSENCRSFTKSVYTCIIVFSYKAIVSIDIVYCLQLYGSPNRRRCRLAEEKATSFLNHPYLSIYTYGLKSSRTRFLSAALCERRVWEHASYQEAVCRSACQISQATQQFPR